MRKCFLRHVITKISMADLDSFFAKKDKKKKKGKEKKFPTTSSTSMVKTLEATDATQDKHEKEKEVKIDVPAAPSQDDEWHEHEEQTQDLEGLKVQALRLDDSDKAQARRDAKERNADEQEDMDGSEEKKSMAASAWQKKSSTPVVTESSSEQPPAEKTVTSGGVYIPPSRRQGPTGSRRAPNQPPDIQNASAFPSLQASVQPTGKEKAIDKEFKEVKSYKGGRSSDPSYEAPSLELTNKYSALRSN